eukprot:3295373-Pyramimonas_sp.AAC.1
MEERRLAWDNCLSTPVNAARGVLPGCAMAMFALQCVMLTTFDSLEKHTAFIPRTLDLYDDDTTASIRGAISKIGPWSVEVLRLLAHVLKLLGLPPASHKMKMTSSDPRIGQRIGHQLRSLGY